MNVFAVRDHLSIWLYRLVGSAVFGGFGRAVRIVWPLRLVGCRWMTFEDAVTLQYGAYVAAIAPDGKPPALRIGRGTLIGNHVHIICSRRVTIGAKVLIADRVYISDDRHQYEDVALPVMEQPLVQLRDVSIGEGTWLGENVCVMGCSIGRQCVIGANSVVHRDIPDYSVAAGSPAVIIKRYDSARGEWRRTHPGGEFLE